MPIRPLILADLDDTLFQTGRHLPPDAATFPATHDKQGQVLGVMTAKQQQLVQWLLTTTDLIPVTARSIEALSRVQLPFSQGAICSHGAVILDRQGQPVADWAQQMTTELEPYQHRLQHWLDELPNLIRQVFGTEQDTVIDQPLFRYWLVTEQLTGTDTTQVYLVIKHNQGDLAALKQLVRQAPAGWLDGFYLHRNGNNLAILPQVVSKTHAVRHYLSQRDLSQHPVVALGDSLSDVGFMQLCDWWGMPAQSQLCRWISQHLQQYVSDQGGYEYD